MMNDWTSTRSTLLEGIGRFGSLAPEVVAAYQKASAAGAKSDHLGEKTRQLIALAVAVTTRCDGCISVHAQEAVKAGATREEVAEALGVAIALNTGAALVYSSRAFSAVEEYQGR